MAQENTQSIKIRIISANISDSHDMFNNYNICGFQFYSEQGNKLPESERFGFSSFLGLVISFGFSLKDFL